MREDDKLKLIFKIFCLIILISFAFFSGYAEDIAPEAQLDKLLKDELAFKIVFDVSEIKTDLEWYTPGKVFYSKENILILQNLELSNPPQDFNLSIKSAPAVFDLPKQTLTVFPSGTKWQFYILVDDQQISANQKVFNLIGKVVIKGDNFILKAKKINWQEQEHKIVIKLFYWLKEK